MDIYFLVITSQKGQFSGQSTLTNKVNRARDNANFDFIELVYPKNLRNKKNHLSNTLMTEIEMVSIVVNITLHYVISYANYTYSDQWCINKVIQVLRMRA